MRNVKTICALIVIIFITACSALLGPKPEVSIVNAAFADVNLLETGIEFTVRVTNNTPDPISFSGATHHIYLNGSDIGTGSNGDRLTVPRFGSATQKVRINLSNIGMLSNIRSLVTSNKFDYRIKSQFYLEPGGVFERKIEVDREGRYDFSNFAGSGGGFDPE